MSKVFELIAKEQERQDKNVELIASENIVSRAVLLAAGGVLTNKYAEGLPGKRYYGGCQYVDVVEDLARARACQLFGADHANVQPHSGAQANMAVIMACLLLKGSMSLLSVNIDSLIKDLENENEIVAFVDEEFTKEESKALVNESLTHPTDRWYNLALTVSKDGIASYVDGVQQSSYPLKYDRLAIGEGVTSVGVRQNMVCWFKGAILKILVTPKVLAPDQFLKDQETLNK